KDIDRAVVAFHILNKVLDMRFVGHVNAIAHALNTRSRGFGACLVNIGTHHKACPLGMKLLGQGFANAASCACYHHYAVVDFHTLPFWLGAPPWQGAWAYKPLRSLYSRTSARATTWWCTSSGPSANRRVRWPIYISLKGDHWLRPVAPCTCMAASIMSQHFSGTIALIIDTQMRASLLPRVSMALAAFNTIKRMASISIRARDKVSMFLPRSIIFLPKASRPRPRSSMRSNAFSAAPMERMQW